VNDGRQLQALPFNSPMPRAFSSQATRSAHDHHRSGTGQSNVFVE